MSRKKSLSQAQYRLLILACSVFSSIFFFSVAQCDYTSAAVGGFGISTMLSIVANGQLIEW
ncbi:hypothetical protein ACQKWADRAFT_285326 [Trichoderma austrokoningii]